MEIAFKDICPFSNWSDHKVHVATYNQTEHPLDVFVRSRDEWTGWNTWKASKNDFNRKYIFSIMDFYPLPDVWLFGGIYEVLKHHADVKRGAGYDVQLTPLMSDYIGRLQIRWDKKGRARGRRLEGIVDDWSVHSILAEPYSGKKFPGYDQLHMRFSELEPIFKISKPDWKAALENIKGIYLITDQLTRRKYVGSAYSIKGGSHGIWSRWSEYLTTGHGNQSAQLKAMLSKPGKGLKYARENFSIALLEYYPMRTSDQFIIERENFWMDVLLTRTKFGLNGPKPKSSL